MRLPTSNTVSRRRRLGRGGFTVMEILIAMGIFTLGFTAVISLFPAGLLMQRQTVEDLTIDDVVEQATTLLRLRPFHAADLSAPQNPNGIANGDFDLHPLPLDAAGDHLLWDWPVQERSFPSRMEDVTGRQFFWVPMVRRVRDTVGTPRADDWEIWLFVFRVDHVYRRFDVTVNPWTQGDDGEGGSGVKFIYHRDQASEPLSVVGGPWYEDVWANPSPYDPPDYPDMAANPEAPEWPMTPKMCMLQADIREETANPQLEGRRLDFENFDAADPSQRLKIKNGELIIDRYARVHEVFQADKGGIDLRDSRVIDPYNNAVPATVDFWYAPPPSYRVSKGEYEMDASYRSPLKRIVKVTGAVVD